MGQEPSLWKPAGSGEQWVLELCPRGRLFLSHLAIHKPVLCPGDGHISDCSLCRHPWKADLEQNLEQEQSAEGQATHRELPELSLNCLCLSIYIHICCYIYCYIYIYIYIYTHTHTHTHTHIYVYDTLVISMSWPL